MTHDWLSQLEDLIAQKIREGALDTPPGLEGLAVKPQYEFTLETGFDYSTLIQAEFARQRAEDNALLTQAAIKARGLDQGLMIVQKDGRVASVEPSPHILAGTAYVVDGRVLGVLHDTAEWGAPQWSLDGPIID